MKNIVSLKSNKITISAKILNKRYRLFKIQFQQDGSIFIHFPYQPDGEGILCKSTLHANQKHPSQISLKDGGKVTAHKIKFTHHIDGEAHFSQDGKIHTEIRKKSVKLKEYNGHLFTIKVTEFTGFNCSTTIKEKNNKNKEGALDIVMDKLHNLKFTCYIFNSRYLKEQIFVEGNEPKCYMERVNQSNLETLIIENRNLMDNKNYYLFLGYEIDSTFKTDSDNTLLFLGGFDPPKIALNHNLETSFLSLIYPAGGNYEELLREIGTVDILTTPKVHL